MAEQVQNGEQTFLDQNGAPLAGGFVYFYAPNTSTPAPTWQDQGRTVLNTNPVVLDQAGRAVIWGLNQYRQVVTDQFGNVQWDRITSAGLAGNYEGDLRVTGTLSASSVVVDNGLTVPNADIGNLRVDNSGVFNGAATFNALSTFLGPVSMPGGITGNLNLTGNMNITGQLGVPTLSTNNLSAQNATIGTIGAPASQTNVQFTNDLVVEDPGKHIRVVSADNPCFSMGNTTLSTNYGMWNTGITISWGTTDATGEPLTAFMALNGEGVGVGSLSISGDFVPFTNLGGSLGQVANAWNNIVGHNYITVSTDVTSPVAAAGFLDSVKGVPVKTLPHLGIAEDDLKSFDWAKVEVGAGVNYNVLVGALWKALQELDAKFDAYVAAHP